MPNLYKSAVRNSYKHVRALLTEPFQKKIAKEICRKIQEMEVYKSAKYIGLYQSHSGEIDLNELWLYATSQEKKCYFPAVKEEKKLVFLPSLACTPTLVNRFGILEPNLPLSAAIPIEKLDVIFVPLLAFDSKGNRLGRGGGYYDIALQNTGNTLIIGLGYAFQEEPLLLADAWDIPLNIIVTEKAIHYTHRLCFSV